MADDVIATTKVRLEADVTGFKQQAEQQVKAAIPQGVMVPITADPASKQNFQNAIKAATPAQVEVPIVPDPKSQQGFQAAIDAQIAKVQELAARAQTETFRAFSARAGGDEAGAVARELKAGLFQLEATIAQMRAAQLQALDLAGTAIGVEREQLLAAAEAFEAAHDRLQRDLAQARRTGRLPGDVGGPGGPAGPERPGGIRGFLRAGVAGRESGIAGILGAGLRLGGIGIAATAAFQAVGELQQSLRVTGDEAFTAEGKLRNLGAELLGGNIIGGIKAITAVRKAEFTGDLGDQITAQLEKQKAAADPLSVSMEKLNLLHQQGGKAVEFWVGSMISAGHITLAQGAALLEVNSKLDSNTKLTEAAADAWANYTAKVEKAGSVTAAFGPDSAPGPRGAAAIAASNAQVRAQGGPTFVGTGGRDVGNEIRASITSRIQDDQKRAQLELRDAKIVQAQRRTTFENLKESVKGTEAAAAAWADYVKATTDVKLKTAAAAAATQAAAQHALDLAASVRESQIATIRDPIAAQQARVANAKILEQNAKTALEATKKGTKAQKDADAAYRIAINNRIAEQNQLTTLNEQAAKAAADSARSAREQALQNDISAAELSGNIPRIRRAFDAAIAYWRSIANNAKLADEEQENARGVVLGLVQAKQAALKPEDIADIRRAKLQNNLAEAELKGLDPRPFLRALIANAKATMDAAEEGSAAFEEARGVLIQARQNFKTSNQTLNDLKAANAKARAALTESTADDEKLIRADIRYWTKRVAATKGMGIVHQRAIAELLKAEGDLKSLVDEVKPTTTVFDLLTEATKSFTEHAGNVINARSRFTADTFTSGLRGEIGTTPNAAGRARLGLDGNTTAVDRNTTALDNLTRALLGGLRGDQGRAGTRPRATASSGGGGGWGESYTAWRARAGIN